MIFGAYYSNKYRIFAPNFKKNEYVLYKANH